MRKKLLAFDIETTGFYPWRGHKIFSFVITDEDFNSEVIDIKEYSLTDPGFKRLKRIIENPKNEIIAHNLKFELHFLRYAGIKVPNLDRFHDTMIMSQICNNLEFSHALDNIFDTYCSDRSIARAMREVDKKVQVQAKLRNNRYDKIDKELMKQYQINDGVRTMALFNMFKEPLKPMYSNYRNEIELIDATQKMEAFGLRLDITHTLKMKEDLLVKTREILEDSFNLFNGFVNLNSDDEIRKIFFNSWKFPVIAETESGKASVDKEAIFHYKEQFPERVEALNKILQYRSWTKGISMMDNYLSYADEDGIIHHSIKTNHAKTGRQSSSNPNLQNVAKDDALKNPYPVPARTCFIPRDGAELGFVDYSGIEMRLIIDAVKDPTMTEHLWAGGDIHALASEYWFGEIFTNPEKCLEVFVPNHEHLFIEMQSLRDDGKLKDSEINDIIYGKARKLLRGAGKNAQFGLAYGATLEVLASTLLLPLEMIKPGYDAYRAKFPLIANFTQDSMRRAKNNGYVTTSFGRRLLISKESLHVAANYTIQGTAAEMLKRATVRCTNWLEKNFPEVKIILPIHDELVTHWPAESLPYKKEIILELNKLLTEFTEITVPLETEWGFASENWNKKIDFSLS